MVSEILLLVSSLLTFPIIFSRVTALWGRPGRPRNALDIFSPVALLRIRSRNALDIFSRVAPFLTIPFKLFEILAFLSSVIVGGTLANSSML